MYELSQDDVQVILKALALCMTHSAKLCPDTWLCCCYRVQVILDAYGDCATSTQAASNIARQQSKAADGKWPQLPLPTTNAVSSALPTIQPGLHALQPDPTFTRPALPARPKAAQVPRTAQPRETEATTVGQEHTVAGVPDIIVPAAPAPAVISTSDMLGDDHVHNHVTEESPARYAPQHWY